jgi:hypothetical protein
MNRWCLICCLLLAWTGCAVQAQPHTWPRLDKPSNSAYCAQALQLAKAMFQSGAFYLYAPPVIPADFGSDLVLAAQALDISGGDGLKEDDTVFDKLPIGGEPPPRSLYWQKKPSQPYRIVVREVSAGWRGDMYSLDLVDVNIGSAEYLARIRTRTTSAGFVSVVAMNWRPPLIFRDKRNGAVWFIDVGQPFEAFHDWRMHVIESDGIKSPCSVQFRSPVKHVVNLLPPAVRALARMLDGTLGRGENEGSLQPTAKLALEAEHAWANAALRPWATREPNNTREEVDSGLLMWSHNGAGYLRAYQEIQSQYPKAEQSLAAYYQQRFGLPLDAAKQQAAFVLDAAFRSYYTFPSQDPNKYFRKGKIRINPWPRK